MDSIVSLQLINTDTQKPISSLTDGQTLNLATLPTKNLTISAITNPAKVGSVVFTLDGVKHIENFPPYAIAGDVNGIFTPWTPNIGTHTLVITPFSGANATGGIGTALTVTFSVINTPAPTPTPSPSSIPAFIYNGSAEIDFDGQNFTITIKGTLQ